MKKILDRLFITVLPNGIDNNEYPKFSIMLGFDNVNDIASLNKSDLLTNMNNCDFVNILYEKINNLKLDVKDEKTKKTEMYENLFSDDLGGLKQKLNKLCEFVSDENPVEYINQNLTNFYSSTESKKPLFSDEHIDTLDEITGTNSLVENVAVGTNGSNAVDTYNNLYEKNAIVEEAYDDIEKKAREIYYGNKFKGGKEGTYKSLENIFSTLYQNPIMARYYGVIIDFSVKTDSYWPNDKKEKDISINIELVDKNNFGLMIDNKSIPLKVRSFPFDGAYKHYHGLEDYGFLDSSSIDYRFSVTSLDSKTNRVLPALESSAYYEANGKKGFNQNTLGGATTEGIILYRKDTKNKQKISKIIKSGGKNTENAKDANYVLGNRVSVIKNGSDKSCGDGLYSLTERISKYTIHKTDTEIVQHEEYFASLDAALLKGDANSAEKIDTKTLCRWTGDNLVVPVVDDKKEEISDKHKPATSNTTIDGVSELSSFSHSCSLRPKSNPSLLHNNDYSFYIDKILNNGYVIPLHPDKDKKYEISVQELHAMGKVSNFRFYDKKNNSEFLFNIEDPVAPPVFSSECKKENEKENPENHLVYNHNNVKQLANSCFLIPPAISYQAARFQGLFSKESINTNNPKIFVNRYKYLRKLCRNDNLKKINHTNLEYLADPRARYFDITPKDWVTRNWINSLDDNSKNNLLNLNFIINDQLPENDFSYGNATYNDNLIPWKIIVKSAKDNEKVVRKNSSNIIVFYLKKGRDLKFNIGFNQNQDSLKYLESDIKSLANTKKNLKFYIDNPLAPKNIFTISNIPVKPTVDVSFSDADTPISATRISMDGDDKVFYEFSLDNYSDLTVKKVELTTSYDEYYTEPVSSIEELENNLPYQIRRQRKSGYLLAGEHSNKSVFSKKIDDITESNVYKNNFGIKFNFQRDTFNNNQEICRLAYSENKKLRLVHTSSNKADLFINDLKMASFTDISVVNEIKLSYYIDDKKILRCNIIDSTGNVISKDKKLETYGLPYSDITYKNLELNEDIDLQMHIGDGEFSYINGNEFFVLTNDDFKHRIKDITPILHAHTKNENDDDCVTCRKIDNSTSVNINSNKRPKPPGFNVSTLIQKTSSRNKNVYEKLTEHSLLIEIDDWNETGQGELFALIVGAADNKCTVPGAHVVNEKTCAIGRDITSGGYNYLNEPLSKYITVDNSQKYEDITPFLPKYYQNEHCVDGETADVIELTKSLRLFLFKPFYSAIKNKWIVLLKLNLDDAVNNKIDPFVRLVTAKYQPNSEGKLALSELTPAKYMQIYSNRSIKVDLSQVNNVIVTISSGAKRTPGKSGSSITSYVICLREKGEGEFTGKIINIKKVALCENSNKITVDIEKQSGNLCVYEFDDYSESTIAYSDMPEEISENCEPLLNQKYRLVYAEHIRLE